MEFLVHFTIHPPPGTAPDVLEQMYADEALAAGPMIRAGYMRRVWREPGTRNHWALWYAPDANLIHTAYSSFPMWQAGWATAEVIPLAVNGNDPGWPKPDPTSPLDIKGGELTTVHLGPQWRLGKHEPAFTDPHPQTVDLSEVYKWVWPSTARFFRYPQIRTGGDPALTATDIKGLSWVPGQQFTAAVARPDGVHVLTSADLSLLRSMNGGPS
jgi:muconolactone D-isomerase